MDDNAIFQSELCFLFSYIGKIELHLQKLCVVFTMKTVSQWKWMGISWSLFMGCVLYIHYTQSWV